MENKKYNPLISVVTVTYNAGKTLENTIKNIINQNYKNYEYIIIDGKSEDNTLDIIDKYKNKINFFISEHDNGIYDAMNKALKYANGDFIIFIGCDDTFASKTTLTDFVNIIKNKDKDLCYYGNVILEKEKKIYDGEFNKYKITNKNICHQAIFYSKKVYKNCKYDISYKIRADHKYNIVNFKKLKYINLIVANFNNITGFSSTSPEDQKFIKRKYLLYLRYLGLKTALTALYCDYKYNMRYS